MEIQESDVININSIQNIQELYIHIREKLQNLRKIHTFHTFFAER